MVADFAKKQKSGDKLMLKVLSVLFLCLAVFLIVANIKLYQKKKVLLTQVQNYTDQIKKIQESSKKLQDEIANTNNSDYIEKVAREEANMQKPGEKVVSFIMPQAKPAEKPKDNSWTAGLSSFWKNVVEFFK